MKCPVCDIEAIVVERDSIEIDWCPSCRGLWFDAGEIELLCEKTGIRFDSGSLGTPVAREIQESPRLCPRCDTRMTKIDLDGSRPVVVDRCARGHGLWFDAGELGSWLEGRPSHPESSGEPITRFLSEVIRRR